MASKSSPSTSASDLLGLPSLSDLTGTSAAESGSGGTAGIGDFIVGGTKTQLSPWVWLAIAVAAVAAVALLRG